MWRCVYLSICIVIYSIFVIYIYEYIHTYVCLYINKLHEIAYSASRTLVDSAVSLAS